MQHKENTGLGRYDRGERPLLVRISPLSISHHRGLLLSNNLYKTECEVIAACANDAPASTRSEFQLRSTPQRLIALYTPEERVRRDATPWTMVQGILAPIQFLIFLVSLFLVGRYLVSGDGLELATASIVAKTSLLYAIMITGSIWEREVFGVYLFAPAFFWEDVFSFLVLALHTAYLAALFLGMGTPREQMFLALAAYASYVVNATQFIMKLRAARRDEKHGLASVTAMSGDGA